MTTPLEGLRVIELGIAIQGPAVGLHFANMGADVLKVEAAHGRRQPLSPRRQQHLAT